jgi:multicomponent Na+:H+ antiporter subunit G
MSVPELAGNCFLFVGGVFFLVGTVGLLRFPDVYTRLHALTKVDNLGLGFTVLGLMIQAPDILSAAKLVLVWLLALLASATGNFLIIRRAFDRGIVPWTTGERENGV